MPYVTTEGSRSSVRQDILRDEECSAMLVDSSLLVSIVDQNTRKIICGKGCPKMNVSSHFFHNSTNFLNFQLIKIVQFRALV